MGGIVGQHAGRRREGGAADRFRQVLHADRAAEAHLLVEHDLGEVAQAGQLAGAAGENDAPAGGGGDAAILQRARISSKISSRRGWMMPMSRERGTWFGALPGSPRLLAHLRHVDQIVFVGAGADGAAIQVS